MVGRTGRRYRAPRENQAIHLGTYVAAADSVLRRMRNEGDQDSAFYLHRIRLCSGLAIEPGWRDEHSSTAAKITTFDLAVEGIRYLNAYEAIAGLSLAVARGAIEATQCVLLPIPSIVTHPTWQEHAHPASVIEGPSTGHHRKTLG